MFNAADDELFDAGEGGKSAKWQMGLTCSARLLNHNLFSLSQLICVVSTVALSCKAQQQMSMHNNADVTQPQ